MDLTIFLSLVVVIIILFILAYEWGNPFIYVGIILLCLAGLLLAVDSPVTYTLGEYTYTATTITPVVYTMLPIFNIGLIVFFAMGVIGSGVMWSVNDSKT